MLRDCGRGLIELDCSWGSKVSLCIIVQKRTGYFRPIIESSKISPARARADKRRSQHNRLDIFNFNFINILYYYYQFIFSLFRSLVYIFAIIHAILFI